MKKFALIAVVVFGVGLMVPAGVNAVPNFLVNGSFESGGLTGWTTGGGDTGYPVAVIITDGIPRAYPNGAFNEGIPQDNAIGSLSPDLPGNHAAYFVDDNAHQTLTQSGINLSDGLYQIGFDTYIPSNGYNNTYTATFTGTVAGNELVSFDVKLNGTPQLWTNYSSPNTHILAGVYDVTFDFAPGGYPAADVVVDRVYITNEVPEPATMLLLASGLLGMAAFRRKFKK